MLLNAGSQVPKYQFLKDISKDKINLQIKFSPKNIYNFSINCTNSYQLTSV